jgi:acetylglutamate kinase
MVLGGPVNSGIVELINRHGAKAVGLTGKDGYLIKAKKYMGPDGSSRVDYGLVGDVEVVNPEVLEAMMDRFVPVIAPLGVGADGTTYNINADTVAGKIAGALKAAKFVILTDQEGVLGRDGRLQRSLTESQARRFIEEGVISGGMLPKVECCLQALKEGVGKAHIIDGRVEHCLLLEVFTEKGLGTEILPDTAGGN